MALKWNRMKDGMRIEWERMIWKGMNGKSDDEGGMKRERKGMRG